MQAGSGVDAMQLVAGAKPAWESLWSSSVQGSAPGSAHARTVGVGLHPSLGYLVAQQQVHQQPGGSGGRLVQRRLAAAHQRHVLQDAALPGLACTAAACRAARLAAPIGAVVGGGGGGGGGWHLARPPECAAAGRCPAGIS